VGDDSHLVFAPETASTRCCSLAVPFSDPSWKLPPVMYTTPNKRVWKLPTSTQLCATWYTDSLDMVVLTHTGASRYHNLCIDGGTSPEYFGYHLVLPLLFRMLLPTCCADINVMTSKGFV
jgi:hypothetical protein